MIVRSSLGGDLLVLSTIFGLTNAIFSGRPARDSSARLIARFFLCFVERMRAAELGLDLAAAQAFAPPNCSTV
jgi:hypothetical protein